MSEVVRSLQANTIYAARLDLLFSCGPAMPGQWKTIFLIRQLQLVFSCLLVPMGQCALCATPDCCRKAEIEFNELVEGPISTQNDAHYSSFPKRAKQRYFCGFQ